MVRLWRDARGTYFPPDSPEELTILTVVYAAIPIRRVDCSLLKLPNYGVRLCALCQGMYDAILTVEVAFRSATLPEQLANPSSSISQGNSLNSNEADTAPYTKG